MLKRAFGFAACSLLFLCATAEEKNKDKGKKAKEETSFDESFLNIKAGHERENFYALGPKNTSIFALNPFLSLGDFSLEGDACYGRTFSYRGPAKKDTGWWGMAPEGHKADFCEYFGKKPRGGKKTRKEIFEKAIDSPLNKPHFYRNYVRAVYRNRSADFRAVLGDTTTRNTIGFQQAMSGGGVSIFRQSGNGSVINGGSPILITRPSKVEYRVNGMFICQQNFKPGLYSIDDLAEEAKLPGATFKIRDQIDRTETLKVDYFGGYDMLAQGKDDFDLTILCPHKWDLEDPFRIKYKKKPRYSGNYRYGYSDDLTIGIGAQAYENSYTIDGTVIFAGSFGKISPNIAYSDARSDGKTRRTGGAGIFYAIPENDTGVFLEAFLAFQGKGYSDLGCGADETEAYDAFIDKYFRNDNDIKKFRSDGEFAAKGDASTRKITIRLYTKPIWGITPAVIFNGEWTQRSGDRSNDRRLREYSLSFTKEIFKNCTLILIGGLSYDDPSGGRNRRAPDRRFNATFCYNINSEFMLEGTYLNYDEKQKRSYGHFMYRPEEIEGLSLETELYRKPGMAGHIFTLKYENAFFDFSAAHDACNMYKNGKTATDQNYVGKDGHNSLQKIYVGTNVSGKGFKHYKKNGFNILK